MITQKRQASTEVFRPKYGMNALILRYNEALQKVIGAKTKPEPWLHCAMADDGEHNYYAIYVWDTRKVVEEGRTAIDTLNVESSKGIVHANDNKQPLDGLKSDVVAKLFRKGAGKAKPGHEHMYDNMCKIHFEDGVEGFMLKIKGQPGQYYTDKVFDTKEEAKAYAEQNSALQYCSIVKERSTPTKAEQQLSERQERARQRSAKRNEQEQRKAEVAKHKNERKNANANWEGSSSANKMFKSIRLQFDVMPDAEFPNKTTFVKWVDAHWHEFVED